MAFHESVLWCVGYEHSAVNNAVEDSIFYTVAPNLLFIVLSLKL